MGCFLACFGSKKERRRRKKSAKRVLPKDHQIIGCDDEPLQLNVQENGSDEALVPTIFLNKDQGNAADEPLEPTISLNKDHTEKLITPDVEPRDKLEEQLSCSTRRKVTFDPNVQTYEGISTQEVKNYDSEDEKEQKGTTQSGLNSLSYPSNHRYQNCSNSDDEYELAESEESDIDGDDDDYTDDEDEDDHQQIVQDESSDSFFSLPSAVQQKGSETPLAEKEVNSPLLGEAKSTRDRSQYVHSVLNPIENLTQWKAVKMRSKPPLNQPKEKADVEKEVQIPFSSEPSFRFSPYSSNPKPDRSGIPKEDIAVDTSLSNWLSSSEMTPASKTSSLSIGTKSAEGSRSQRSNSPRSHEDRPILGALTVEEIRQFSATSSPRKSPSRSPDDMPILGTVGSYWNHTGQAMDSSSDSSYKGIPTMDSSSDSSYKGIPNSNSKYSEDRRVNWHTTPFERRLERALNKGEPEAYSC